MSKKHDSSLAIKDGLIEIGRQDGTPMWIWASTCPDQECDCRSALIIAAQGDKEYLMRAARAAAMIRRARKGPGALEGELGEDCAAFELDIGTGEFRPLNSGVDSTGRLYDARAGLERRYPWLGAVFKSIDGETLEKIGRLWFRGKGRPDPESSPQSPGSVDGWRPGEVVSPGCRRTTEFVRTSTSRARESTRRLSSTASCPTVPVARWWCGSMTS